RAADGVAERRAPPHAHREPDPLGEGRPSRARGTGGALRVPAAGRARRRAVDRRGRGLRRASGRAGDRLRAALRGRRERSRGAGLYEAYTYSLQAWDPDPQAIELPEPLSSQQRVLRTTLAVGLLGAARHNLDMGNSSVELFEIAHVYLPPGPVPDERWRLGGI